ncbi:MAG: ATP-dependent zinc metalloprotease FtsH, partial [Ruminococcus sp.]|nr:ATP-dependent zinc metalloprotease FtsH [Ruminococcus sp.]
HMRENIIMLLGGRVAEELILDDICTGASNDIERATNTARNMVTRYGFSKKLGTVVYGSSNDEVFLGKDYGHTRNYSEAVAAEIDEEVRGIIEKAYADCTDILRANIDKLHLLAKYLLKFEKIDGEDFEKMMRGEITEAVLNEPVFDESEPEMTTVKENATEEN